MNEWERSYEESLAHERERLHEATGGPGGCLKEAAADLLGELALGVAVCAAGAVLVVAFQARPGLTSAAATAVLGAGWLAAWRASRSRVAAGFIVGGIVAFFVWTYLAYCGCG